jgi:hypothetical protein
MKSSQLLHIKFLLILTAVHLLEEDNIKKDPK